MSLFGKTCCFYVVYNCESADSELLINVRLTVTSGDGESFHLFTNVSLVTIVGTILEIFISLQIKRHY